MGKLLQVRVSASTLDPGKVESSWPILSHLAYPPGHDYAPAKRGVLELIDTLRARLTAGDVPQGVADKLKAGLGQAEQLARQLEDALASWQAEKAQQLTDKIEDALDELEDRAGYR